MQVADAEARGQHVDEQAPEVQAARAAEREAAAQLVAHQEQVGGEVETSSMCA